MNMPSRKILGTGLFALDMVLSPEGKLLSSGLGGSAGNVLAILATLGWSSTPIARLGDDLPGRKLVGEFLNLNADIQYFQKSANSATPVIYQHQLEGEAETHCFSFSCPICGIKRSPKSSFLSDEIADSIFSKNRADVLYLDRPTKLGVELAERYRDTNTLIVFEPSTVGDDTDLFYRALRCAHIVKYADDRLSDLGKFPIGDVAIEICTMGSAGLRYRGPSLGLDWVHLDAIMAPWVVDTSGAGDWCTAGMLYHLFTEQESFDIRNLEYNALSRALKFGQVLSALNCMTLGARGLTRSLSAKKITATGHYLKNALLKADATQTKAPDSSWLAYELLRSPLGRRKKTPMVVYTQDQICCNASS